jgi:prophage regulatory protein
MAQSLARDLARNGTYGLQQQGAIAHHVEMFLRLEEVKRATGLGRSTLYLLISENRFPKPVKINGEGGKAVAWLSSEIAEWQRQRIAARDNAEAA